MLKSEVVTSSIKVAKSKFLLLLEFRHLVLFFRYMIMYCS